MRPRREALPPGLPQGPGFLVAEESREAGLPLSQGHRVQDVGPERVWPPGVTVQAHCEVLLG